MKKIWEIYVFGKLDAEGNIVYFTPTSGGLKTKYRNSKGRVVNSINMNPTEADMNAAGWYRVVNVAEDGVDAVVDNILYHYTGAVTEEPFEGEPGEGEGEGPNVAPAGEE